MRDLYDYIFFAVCTEETRLLNKLHSSERIMKVTDYDLSSLWNYMKVRVEYRYFKDFTCKLLNSIKYYDSLK